MWYTKPPLHRKRNKKRLFSVDVFNDTTTSGMSLSPYPGGIPKINMNNASTKSQEEEWERKAHVFSKEGTI